MDYNLYELTDSTFPCWIWQEGKLERSSIALPKNESAIGEALNALGYYSVCSYTETQRYSAGIVTYLYRKFGGASNDAPGWRGGLPAGFPAHAEPVRLRVHRA